LILRGEAIPAGASVVTTTMATITDAMRMALAPFELSGEPDATLRSGFPLRECTPLSDTEPECRFARRKAERERTRGF
jgi:hypothetical protein